MHQHPLSLFFLLLFCPFPFWLNIARYLMSYSREICTEVINLAQLLRLIVQMQLKCVFFSYCHFYFVGLKGATPHGAGGTQKRANGEKAPGKSRVKKGNIKRKHAGKWEIMIGQLIVQLPRTS